MNDLRCYCRQLVAAVFLLLLCGRTFAGPPHLYIFFGTDRNRITESGFLNAKRIEGAQIKYTWKQLEHARGEYDFTEVHHDLDFLTAHGKRLFIQLQDVSFDAKYKPFPKYLLSEPEFHGGADQQYDIAGDDENHATPAGWVARRWNPAVRERWQKLIAALGKEFDGKVEGINLPETAVDFGETGKLYPGGFTPDSYREAIVSNMAALKAAFPKSVAMQYANFMPEKQGDTENHNLHTVYQKAGELRVALGGPDLLPYKPGQMRNSYPLMREYAGKVPTGIAVQDGNQGYKNPKTQKQVTTAELMDFGTNYLKVGYFFWCMEEPYYSQNVLPYFQDGVSPPALK